MADRNIERIFVDLRRAWHPPSASTQTSFTRLTRTLAGIYATLGNDRELAPLHREIYSEFPGLPGGAPPPGDGDTDGGADTTVKSFYLCNSLIQLMEDVYIDLRLEREYRHPDNRGWMNLFQHWAQADTFRKAWALSAPSYGLRFQSFCQRQFDLSLGRTTLRSLWDACYSNRRPLDDDEGEGLVETLDTTERRVIEILTSEYLRGQKNPIQPRVRQILVAQLEVPSGRYVELVRVGRRVPNHEERASLLTVTYGIAVIEGEGRHYTKIKGEGDRRGRLLTLRVRRHLRDQGLGRKLMEDLVRRAGVRDTKSPTAAQMRAVGLHAGSIDRIESLFKSVFNEVELEEQRSLRQAGDPVFGLVPRMPYSGVVRPEGASWTHAVGFIYWILTCCDGDVTPVEAQAALAALVAWAGPHVEESEVAYAVRESLVWYLAAKRPVQALYPEVQALIRALEAQPWFDELPPDDELPRDPGGRPRTRREILHAGLKRIVKADGETSEEEAKLIESIERWLLAAKMKAHEKPSAGPSRVEPPELDQDAAPAAEE